MTVYPTDPSACALCQTRVAKVRHFNFYLIGRTTALAYVLCKRCEGKARSGLPKDDLARLERRLDAVAAKLGMPIGKEDGGNAC